ncbi:MAG: BlaI/MecI/CopY family transcriptional regulator [Acidobacteria bacterium]|nr:BlaI/MecI/CopY family transcriptional regulator [Acidobacteriota bacterium]
MPKACFSEREVMAVVWDAAGEVSVRDVRAGLKPDVAYTTVMTTLDRLFKKGFLARAKRGRAYMYTASVRPHELETAVTSRIVRTLPWHERHVALPFLSNLVDTISERDRELLDDLEGFVRRKRRDLRRRGRR